MTWYRKYRPTKIADLNLVKVRNSFLKMLESGKIPQALLFAGPKGTGKTSSSRIIGALLNDEKNALAVETSYFGQKNKIDKKLSLVEPDPTTEFAQKVYKGQSFVVQEMDAASNRGIDDVRGLKERIMMPPQEGKIAVYILDEVHMFTNDAFNALLKILEEPPQHVVFILATTELHKLPATIVSRCTVVNFYKASNEEILEALKNITKAEKIKVDDEQLSQIADFADGSFRDAVKILEQVCQSGKFSPDSLDSILNSSIFQTIEKILQTVLDKDEIALVNIFQELRQQDLDQGYFHKSLFKFLHSELLKTLGVVEGEPFSSQAVIRYFLTQLLEINLDLTSPIPFLPIEIKLLEIIDKAKNKNSETKDSGGGVEGGGNKKMRTTRQIIAQPSQIKQSAETNKIASYDTFSREKELVELEIAETDVILNAKPSLNSSLSPTLHSSSNNTSGAILLEKWEDFVRDVNQENSSLGALLRSSHPIEEENGRIKVGVYYRFHQEQLKNPKFKDIYHVCMERLFDEKFDFDFVLKEAPSETIGLVQPNQDEEARILSEHHKSKEIDEKKDSKSKLASMASEALM